MLKSSTTKLTLTNNANNVNQSKKAGTTLNLNNNAVPSGNNSIITVTSGSSLSKSVLKVKKVKNEPTNEITSENNPENLAASAPVRNQKIEVGGLLAAIPEAFSKGEVRCLCKVGTKVWAAGSFGKLAIYDTEVL